VCFNSEEAIVDKAHIDPIWGQALEFIAQQVNEGVFRIWFEPTVGLGLVGGVYSIGVASEFAKDWIETRFRSIIVEAVSRVVGESIRCDIVVSPELSRVLFQDDGSHGTVSSLGKKGTSEGVLVGGGNGPRDPVVSGSHVVAATGPTCVSMGAAPADSAPSGSGLLGKYTFDTFVIGPSNRFAHAAAQAAAETPGTQYNPLFIYGGVGLGKTHLLQAVGWYVLRNYPGLKVRYITLETFTNDFINSLRDDSIEGFKAKYRTNDVLLIDDIQFLQKKEQTQEEFFHTFNTLYDAQKQIVITSDRHPKGLATLEDRLVSRFEWGLITDIQPPDLETRVAILKKRARAEDIILADDDVLMLIASRVPTNIRELEGCLTRVVAYASFNKRAIDVDLAREVLKDVPETAATRITIDLILSVVADFTGVSATEITGDKRSRTIVEARHLAMYMARELTDSSLPKIGDRLGGRDHTTVIHAVDKINKLIRKDRSMYNRVQLLTTRIKSAQ
jgi:chromosomal replication initiator protein